MGGLGDLGRAVIAVFFLQWRDQHEGVLQAALDIVEARLDAEDAFLRERHCSVGEEADRLEEVIGHHRVVDVQLEMALAAGEGDGGVIAHDMGAYLGQGLALGGVHLARHDGGARLVLRQGKFAKAGAGAGAKEADVVGDFEQGGRDGGDGAMAHDHGVMGGQRLELVGRRFERQAGDGGDALRDAFGKANGRGKAGANGGAALGELHQGREGLLDPLNAVAGLAGVAGEFLTKGQGRRILGVGAADLDDVLPGFGLVIEGVAKLLQGRQEAVVNFFRARNVHRRGEGVVGRLAHIAVVVRVDRGFRAHLAAQHFDGAIGDDFVGVHVGLGAGAGLPDDEGEVIVELALDHLLGGGDDGLAEIGVHFAERHVGLGGGPFDDPEGAHDGGGLGFPADFEIAEGALGLGAPIPGGVDLDRAKGVGFGARCRHVGAPLERYWGEFGSGSGGAGLDATFCGKRPG